MATEQSRFSKLPKKQLVLIAEKLVDGDFPSGNPYQDNDYDEHYKALENIARFFNLDVMDEDVQFFSKFLEINDNLLSKIFGGDKSLTEELIIPMARTYELQYSVWGSCTYDEYLAQNFDAYDKNWVEDSARQQQNDGNFDLYDGRNRGETIYDNFEMSDYEFGFVIELNDDRTNGIRESILKHLVVENTSKVVSSLDKKTLLKLKRIIDSRLSSL
jgi:hypothetical protein